MPTSYSWTWFQVFITNGFLCDVVIVVAITDLEAKQKAKGISLFIVENGMEGFTKGQKPLEKVGQKAVVSLLCLKKQNKTESSFANMQ